MGLKLYQSPDKRFYVKSVPKGWIVVDTAGIIPLVGVHGSLRAAIAKCDAAYRGSF